jgi:hypothetical protein
MYPCPYPFGFDGPYTVRSIDHIVHSEKCECWVCGTPVYPYRIFLNTNGKWRAIINIQICDFCGREDHIENLASKIHEKISPNIPISAIKSYIHKFRDSAWEHFGILGYRQALEEAARGRYPSPLSLEDY